MEAYGLLNDSDLQTLPKDGFGWTYEPDRRLLTVYYIAQKLNIIIDCNTRQIVARYTRDDSSIGYQGGLIGNEFWVGTSNGVVRKPFPNIEDV